MKQRITFALAALLILTPLLSGAASPSKTTSDPNQVVIVTSDIDLFWSVVDGAHGNPDAKAFEEYFSKGSLGVDGFIEDRLSSPDHLAKVFAKNKSYYLKARANMALVPTQVARLRDDLRRYKQFYPQVQFPNFYFVVGALSSGGTQAPGIGTIMGIEMNAKGAGVAQTDVPDVPLSILGNIDSLAPISVHELTHFNQRDGTDGTLLAQSIVEGSADFIAQLADGKVNNGAQWAFGCAHEEALWKLFSSAMNIKDQKANNHWLFSYEAGPLGAPPFIGYWLGSRIVQSYYQSHADKKAAVTAIMHIDDFDTFLTQSGYTAKHPICKPEARWKS